MEGRNKKLLRSCHTRRKERFQLGENELYTWLPQWNEGSFVYWEDMADYFSNTGCKIPIKAGKNAKKLVEIRWDLCWCPYCGTYCMMELFTNSEGGYPHQSAVIGIVIGWLEIRGSQNGSSFNIK